MDQFEHLLELSFRREKRKQMKRRLQGDEHSIQRLIKADLEQKIKYRRKRQLVVFDELKFRRATRILEEKRQAKIQKIKNYMILIALIVIVLAAVLYYFSE
jgi:hypothetical protein